jgi:hypothetical protein
MKRIKLKKSGLLVMSGLAALVSAAGFVSPALAEDCVHASPTAVFLTDSTQTGYPSETSFYTIDITNNDSAGCGSSTFTSSVDNSAYAYEVWASWSPRDAVTVAPGGTVRTAVSVTAESTAAPGTYPFVVQTVQDYDDDTPDAVLGTNITRIVAPFPPPPPGDTTRPNVSILSPTNGAILARNRVVTIRAQASDNVGVTQMIYRTNNGATTICSGGPSLTSCNWLPTKKGAYTLTVTAFDAAGNSRTASVLVNVR